jgi:hypothetical protein
VINLFITLTPIPAFPLREGENHFPLGGNKKGGNVGFKDENNY